MSENEKSQIGDESINKAISLLRKRLPELIANELISIDDPESEALARQVKTCFENARQIDELILDGYRPVSSTDLVWIKEEDPSDEA